MSAVDILKVKGTNIVDKNGKVVLLRGVCIIPLISWGGANNDKPDENNYAKELSHSAVSEDG